MIVGAFLDNIWQIIPMVLLVFASGFLSGAETAFSNISRRQRQSLKLSEHKLYNLAARLTDKPKRLLTSLLFGNMVVNVLFFALASVLSVNLAADLTPPVGVAAGIAAFVILLLFGEMLPKSLAYSNSRRICIAAAPVCYLCTRILSGLLRTIEIVIVAPAVRLLAGHDDSAKSAAVTANEFKLLIESSRQQGLIGEDENQLLSQVIDLSLLKVRHVMKPRVDMLACEVTLHNEKIRKIMTENNLTKIPVYSKEIDNITGLLEMRDLLLKPDIPPGKLKKTVNFVPEQKTVESLLVFFRKSRTDTAIVVDEYGGIAGTVSLEDIAEEIIGPIDQGTQAEAIEQIGPLKYRLAGNIAIHDWAQIFGVDPTQSRLATIGGLTTALLGRIPRSGDVATLKNLKVTVEKVKKHRIETLILSLENVSE